MNNALILGHLIHKAITRKAEDSLFLRIFTIFGIASPLLTVAYAFASSDDAAMRAATVVDGLEKVVLALILGLAAKAMFALGREFGVASVGEAAA